MNYMSDKLYGVNSAQESNVKSHLKSDHVNIGL